MNRVEATHGPLCQLLRIRVDLEIAENDLTEATRAARENEIEMLQALAEGTWTPGAQEARQKLLEVQASRVQELQVWTMNYGKAVENVHVVLCVTP